MIRHTHARNPGGVLSAYSDNAAVLAGPAGARFFAAGAEHAYGWSDEPVDILIKVETHNHPTAISPFPGAATGSGGISDESYESADSAKKPRSSLSSTEGGMYGCEGAGAPAGTVSPRRSR